MKNLKPILYGILLLGITFTSSATDHEGKLTKENIDTKTEAEIEARVKVLEQRLHEIDQMDLSSMERSEKRALKDEIKEIKKEMALDGRITISIGAAILIVLLLILLL